METPLALRVMKPLFLLFLLSALAAPSKSTFDASSQWQKKFEDILAKKSHTFAAGIAEANKILAQEGVSADIYLHSKTDLILSSSRGWRVPAPKAANPCDQRIVNVAVVRALEKSITLPSKNLGLKVELPATVQVPQVQVLDKESKKVFSTFAVPFSAAPMGTSEKGDQIYYRFPLNDARKTTRDWFQAAFESTPEILEDTPFLVIAVHRDGSLHFLDTTEAYEEQDAEMYDASDADDGLAKQDPSRALLFHPYDWVLRFREACD